MKLLCVSPSYWPAFQFGGTIPAVHGLNKALVKKGVNVSVYATNVGLEGKVPVNQEVDVDDVKVTYFAFTKFFEFMGATGWQFSLPMTKALKKNLKTFDLVHLHAIWNYPISVTAHYCRQYETPYIIAPHGALYPYATDKKSWKKWPYYNLIVRRNLDNATAIQYFTKDEITSHLSLDLKNKAVFIPNGLFISKLNNLYDRKALRNRYPSLRDKIVVTFMGRIHQIKGLDILSKAYSRLTKERSNLCLLIVGQDEGGYKKKLKELLKDEGILNRVIFAGMLKGKEKLEALAGSDIFVLPSYSEGFSMAILEAMFAGLPVIISDQCHFPDVAENNAGIIVPCDFIQLAQAIEKLINNAELRQKMGENGQELVRENYTWDKVADKMMDVYEEILST